MESSSGPVFIHLLSTGLCWFPSQHPGDVGYLWRLARALVHLSIHQAQKGDTEEEKQLLQQG